LKIVSQFPGIPMERFGVNPLGAPLYRIVFSDSRTDLLGGKWPDGNCEYREVLRYPGIRGQWIMERWMSPEDYAGTREVYERSQFDPDSGLLTCGPYPRRGEYTYCHTFIGTPTEMQVGWAVHDNMASRGLTRGERKQGIMAPLEKQQKEQDARFDDVVGEALGPFAHADAVIPMSRAVAGERSGWKRSGDMPVERFDQSSPLPTRDNFFGTLGKRGVAKLTGE
jgi:hypothetical protein